MLSDWTLQAAKFAGISQAELARRMTQAGFSLDRAAVNKITKGLRGVSGSELLAISKITGFPVPADLEDDWPSDAPLAKRLPSSAKAGDAQGTGVDAPAPPSANELPYIPIVGRVAAGVWVEVEPADPSKKRFKPSGFPPDPRYPVELQFDLIVEGTSINLFARDGEILRCVDLIGAGIEVRDNDMVVVSRSRSMDERETTAKRVRRRNGKFELWPESDDPRWQEPIVISPGGADQHDEVKIIAIVLYAYKTP